MKRFLISLFIVLIMATSFIGGYSKTFNINVYAANEAPLGYTQTTTRKQLTDAFLAYCKTRDSELTSSVLGGASTFAYSVIQRASQTLGINIDDIQASLYYYNSSNTGLRWFMTSVGVSAFNDIFAYLIQEKGLQVGDEDVNEIFYSGKQFTDADGTSCLIYILPTNKNGNTDSNVPIYLGTYYKYATSQLVSMIDNGVTSISFNLTNGTSYSGSLYKSTINWNGLNQVLSYRGYSSSGNLYNWLCGYTQNNEKFYSGNYVVAQIPNDNRYYLMLLGTYNNLANLSGSGYCWDFLKSFTVDDSNVRDLNVTFISNKIANYYEGDTVYNDNGTIINGDPTDPDPPDPGTPGGGTIDGGGDYGDDININFPDIDFNIPDINFSLGDLSNKFPFSIPSDYKNFVSIFVKSPVAPAIVGDIPLGNFYTWHFDADFSQFDSWAELFRTVELASFCFALIYLTIKIVKG